MPGQSASTPIRRFAVHAEDDERHCRHVEGESFEDAALTFVEAWAPAGDDATVIVIEEETGRRQCFHIALASGEAEPCGPE